MNRANEIIQSTKLQAILTKNTERHDKYFKNTNFQFFFYGSQMAKIDRTNTSQISKNFLWKPNSKDIYDKYFTNSQFSKKFLSKLKSKDKHDKYFTKAKQIPSKK